VPAIIDTSIALKWVLAESDSPQALALRRDFLVRQDILSAPSLLIYEATNTLYAAARDGAVSWQAVDMGLEDILTTIRLRIPSAAIAQRTVAITHRTSQTYAYDAQFLALAEHLHCDLWTADERFLRAVRRHGFSQVKALSAYPLPIW